MRISTRHTRHFWIESDSDSETPLACLRLLEEPDGEFRVGRQNGPIQARGGYIGQPPSFHSAAPRVGPIAMAKRHALA